MIVLRGLGWLLGGLFAVAFTIGVGFALLFPWVRRAITKAGGVGAPEVAKGWPPIPGPLPPPPARPAPPAPIAAARALSPEAAICLNHAIHHGDLGPDWRKCPVVSCFNARHAEVRRIARIYGIDIDAASLN